MSLPEESVAANTLPEVTTIPTGKKLIFTDPDTNEGGIITLENLSKQILQNLTSQTFALDQGNLTLLQALNQLNSKAPFSFNFNLNKSFYIKPRTTTQIILAERANGLVFIYFYPDQPNLILKNISGTTACKITYDTDNKRFIVDNVQSTFYWILSSQKIEIGSL